MSKAKILIIDDDQVICDLLSTMLVSHGYLTEIAHSGEEGVAVVRNGGCDLALIDLQLPDAKGTELLRKFRAIDPELICGLITGYATVQNVVGSFRDGAFGFFIKPFVMEEVLHDIREVLSKRDLEKRLANSQNQIQQNEKMAVIGQLAAGVAHEINNPVGFINVSFRQA